MNANDQGMGGSMSGRYERDAPRQPTLPRRMKVIECQSAQEGRRQFSMGSYRSAGIRTAKLGNV